MTNIKGVKREKRNLNHIDGLDNTGGKHARGTTINEGLNSRPDTNRLGLLLLSHFPLVRIQFERLKNWSFDLVLAEEAKKPHKEKVAI